MIDPNARFYQARLKHLWANEHINHVDAFWKHFLESDFCDIVVEDHPDGGEALRLRSIKPLPAQLLLHLGDAVHNLRCALDYTVNELLRSQNDQLTFPMAKEREQLESSFRTKPESIDGKTKRRGKNADLEQAVPGIGEFIVNEIRPYKGSDGILWQLGKLDNRDKHRLLIAVAVPQTVTGIVAVDANNNRIQGGSFTFGLGGVFNLAHFGAGGIKIEDYGKPTAELILNEPGVIENAPVLPTLEKMSQAVIETINRIDEFVGIGKTA